MRGLKLHFVMFSCFFLARFIYIIYWVNFFGDTSDIIGMKICERMTFPVVSKISNSYRNRNYVKACLNEEFEKFLIPSNLIWYSFSVRALKARERCIAGTFTYSRIFLFTLWGEYFPIMWVSFYSECDTMNQTSIDYFSREFQRHFSCVSFSASYLSISISKWSSLDGVWNWESLEELSLVSCV